MKSLRRLSVRSKLLLIAMVSSAAALVLASIVLIVYDQIDAFETTRQDLRVLAALLGRRTAAALELDDPAEANANLGSLAARSMIVAACMYRGEQVFARYGESVEEGCPPLPAADGLRTGEDSLELFEPILRTGERVGTIYLRSDLEANRIRGRRYAGVVLLVALVAAGVAFVLSTRMLRIVSAPVEHLVRTAETVSREATYSLRAPKLTDDELGVLVDAFNEMLSTVEGRDRELLDANARLEKVVQELEAKNSELERFTYTVSHDLKSPLITIKGYLGLLEKDAFAGRQERMKADLEHIGSAADQMAELLQELLELSRIGRIVNEPEKVPVADLVFEALDRVAGPIERRGVRVEVAPDLPTVVGDRARLGEVFQNLIENAIKFMGEESAPRIEIGICQHDPRRQGDEDVLFVRDNGIGIEPAYLEKVFGLFERLDAQVDGTGIGLAIVQRIVEVHGGRIWVESEGRGRGATFYLTLPGPPDRL